MDALHLIPMHEDASFIEADLSLLAKVFPQSKILQKYSTGNNAFNSKDRDGYVLKELLQKLSIDDILAHRRKSLVITEQPELPNEPVEKITEKKNNQEKKNYHQGKYFPGSNGAKRTTK